MPQIRLNDQLYERAQRRAVEAGFKSVEEYVSEIVTTDLDDDFDLGKAFTPERLSQIDAAAAQIEAGKFHTSAEVKDHFAKRFAE